MRLLPPSAVAVALALAVGCSSGQDGQAGPSLSTSTSPTPMPSVTASPPAPTNTFVLPSATATAESVSPSAPGSPLPTTTTTPPTLSTSGTASTGAATTPVPRQTTPSAAQLAAAATAINLRAGDLRGYTSSPRPPVSAEDQQAIGTFFRCLGFPQVSSEPGIDSPTFTQGDNTPSLSLSSTVSRDEPGVNVGSVRAFGTARGVECFRPYFQEQLRAQLDATGARITATGVSALPVSVPGVDAAAGVRATATVVLEDSGQTRSLELTFDLVVLAEKGFSVTLNGQGVDTALTTAQRGGVIELLGSRLIAAAG